MGRLLLVALLGLGASARLLAAESVVLRNPAGRLLRVERDGKIRAGGFSPGESETLELLADGARVAMRTPSGRWLVPSGTEQTAWRSVKGLDEPPAEAWLQPAAAETPVYEVFRIEDLPEGIRATAEMAISSLALAELEGQEYDKTKRRRRQEYVELPAPTWKDLGRTRRHRVFSATEEYRIRASLDGKAELRISRLALLTSRRDPARRALLFVAQADLPVRGDAGYRIPDALSASTGFRTAVRMRVVGEVGTAGAATAGFSPPRILQIEVSLSRLDLSNDALNTIRSPLEDLINEELRDRQGELRDKANKAIAKALESSQLRLPLLGFLGPKQP